MTIYECDACTREFPGGCKGSSFLVLPDGKTSHFCSGACIRAYVHKLRLPNVSRIVALAFTAGVVAATIIQRLIAH